MSETQFLVSAVAKRSDDVVVKDEITVRSEKLVGHQIGIVGRKEYLCFMGKEPLAYLVSELEMIEGVKIIYEIRAKMGYSARSPCGFLT